MRNTDNLSYVLGAILGDGTVGKLYKGSYAIRLAVKDEDFAETFRIAFSEVLKRQIRIQKRHYRPELFFVEAYSKSFGEWFHSLSNKDILKLSLKHPNSFIRGFADSEGSVFMRKEVSYDNMIQIVNTKKSLIDIVSLLLNSLNIKNFICKTERNPPRRTIYRLYIRRKDSIRRFRNKVGFSIKRKAERLNTIIRKYDEAEQKRRVLIIKVLDLRSKEYSYEKIGRKLGISDSTARKIVIGASEIE